MKTYSETFNYWFISWVSWSYNWCSYKNKYKAYQTFLTLHITSLKTYITNRKLEFESTVNLFNKITKSNEKIIRHIKENDIDHIKIDIFLNNFDTKIATIKGNLRI